MISKKISENEYVSALECLRTPYNDEHLTKAQLDVWKELSYKHGRPFIILVWECGAAMLDNVGVKTKTETVKLFIKDWSNDLHPMFFMSSVDESFTRKSLTRISKEDVIEFIDENL